MSRPLHLLAAVIVGVLAACAGGGVDNDGNGIEPFESPLGFVVADFDGDGRNDVAASVTLINGADFPGHLRVWLQRHDGSHEFDPPVDYPTIPYPNELLRADIDGDGRADLVTVSHSPACCLFDTVTWLRADPIRPGHFEAAPTLHVGARVSHIAAADLDNDGRSDLVLTAYGEQPGVAVLWGAGGGGFLAPEFLRTDDGAAALAVADVDGDGWLDLLFSDGAAVLLLRHGSVPRAFEPAQPLATGRNITFVVAADINRDGLPDIAYGERDSTDVAAPGAMVVLHNDPQRPGRFSQGQRQALAVHAFDAYAQDMNRDGWPDLVVGEPNYSFLTVDMVEVYMARPDAPGLLAAAVRNPLEMINAYTFGVGDINGDDWPDVLASPMGMNQGRLVWLAQDPARPGRLLAPVLLP